MARELWFLQLVKEIAPMPMNVRKGKMSQLISMEIALVLVCLLQKGGDKYHFLKGYISIVSSDRLVSFQI